MNTLVETPGRQITDEQRLSAIGFRFCFFFFFCFLTFGRSWDANLIYHNSYKMMVTRMSGQTDGRNEKLLRGLKKALDNLSMDLQHPNYA